MNLRANRSEKVVLDITPLVDVVFLLLIFFMVSTTFDHNSEVNITLPQASQEILRSKPDAINITIDSEGKTLINDKLLPNNQTESIREALSLAAVGFDEPPVIISADAQASHQSVIRVMDVARQLGLVKITFATQMVEE